MVGGGLEGLHQSWWMMEKGFHTFWDEFMAEVKQWKSQRSLGEDAEEVHLCFASWVKPAIPWMEDPGRLQFIGSQRVGHN